MHDVIANMVAPSDSRPGIWRGGILQIMVTRACDMACHGCTQGSQFGGKPAVMTPDQFQTAIDSLEGYFGVIGVFGGNPCTSPYFDDYCRILRGSVPYDQRGLWCNHPRGKGAVCRATFDPRHSNFNVHLSSDAYDEFARDWPESLPHLKGIAEDSIHGSPWVAMRDVVPDEDERWRLISQCEINRYWSALIGVVRGELRAFFCEIAYAQAALHADNPDWARTGKPMPDTGLPVTPGWWRKPMSEFAEQVNVHCHNCGVPLKRRGQLAVGGTHEEVSETHLSIARPKVRDRPVRVVSIGGPIARQERPFVEYLPGTLPACRGQ